MALTVSARSRFSGPSTASLIKGAAICAAVGIGSSLTEYADYGKWLTVAGVLLLIAGLHRFGRMGPDAAIVFELAPPRRRKKKRKSGGEREGEGSASADEGES
jgi:hypothetical protein